MKNRQRQIRLTGMPDLGRRMMRCGVTQTKRDLTRGVETLEVLDPPVKSLTRRRPGSGCNSGGKPLLLVDRSPFAHLEGSPHLRHNRDSNWKISKEARIRKTCRWLWRARIACWSFPVSAI